MTHYRQGGKLTHAGCEILPDGKDIEYIVIEKIEFRETEEVAGRTEKGVWIATFAPNKYTTLPIILNATNRRRLFKLSQVEHIDTLTNFPVRLTKEKTRDVQDGGETWGLRISKLPPTKPVKKKLGEADIPSAAKFLETRSIEELKEYYDIPKEIELKLKKK